MRPPTSRSPGSWSFSDAAAVTVMIASTSTTVE